MSWYIHQRERTTAPLIQWNANNHWIIHSQLGKTVITLGNLAVTKILSFASKYHVGLHLWDFLTFRFFYFLSSRPPQSHLLLTPLLSQPPWASYGNLQEASSLAPPPGVPEPSWTFHGCLLACLMPTRLWALEDSPLFPQPEECQAHARFCINICRMNEWNGFYEWMKWF